MKKVGLIGVPIENVPVVDYFRFLSVFVPGITMETRKAIVERAKEEGIFIDNLGELCLGEYYNPGFRVSMAGGIPAEYQHRIKTVDIKKLEEERMKILEKARDYDLLVATGPSHLGAIVLYDEDDVVARLDYHLDFANWNDAKTFSYASYLDWVALNIKNVEVINYFIRCYEGGFAFGHNSMNRIENDGYKRANYFDIDVDCFDRKYRMHCYDHLYGPTHVSPELVLSMIAEAKPKKIGIWEYRPEDDYDKNGLEFIVGAIRSAIKN